MKRLCLCLAVLALSTSAFAADVAKDENVYIEGVPTDYEDEFGRGPSLVASIIVGTFENLGPYYQSALDAAGMPADLIVDPYGSWPPLDDYCLILVSTSSMWWTYDYWYQEDAVLDAYMTAGGTCVVVGQDYLWSRPMGINGFPMDWLGVSGANQDVNFGDIDLNWDGTPGGPLEGMSGYISSTPCFDATGNSFYTDEIFPMMFGMCMFTSAQVPWPAEGGSSTPISGFSSVEFGCMSQAELDDVVYALVMWLGHPTPTETTTWGAVKGMFR
jgi:hypothetical protein